MATRPLTGDSISVTMPQAPQTLAQQVFAILGHDGAGDLIEGLLDAMDACDGDIDREENDEDRCSAGDDDVQDGAPCMFGPGDGLPGDPDDAEENGDDEPASLTDQDDDSDNDREQTQAAPDHRHRNKIRRTRCRPVHRRQWYIGGGKMWPESKLAGYQLKREPTVPRAIKRLKRRQPVGAVFTAGNSL